MSRIDTFFMSFLVVLFSAAAALYVDALPVSAQSETFLKDTVERKLKEALPGFEISVSQVNILNDKGFELKDLKVFSEGEKVAEAASVSVGYGSILSYVLFENFFLPPRIEIEGLRMSISSEKRKLLSSLRFPENETSEEGTPPVPPVSLPKIKITDSVFSFGGTSAVVRRAEISFVREEDSGELQIRLRDGDISLPGFNVSVSGFLLDSKILSVSKRMQLKDLSGGGTLETSRGKARMEFGISIPEEEINAFWQGRLSLSEIKFLKRESSLSFDSVTFWKDGSVSVSGGARWGTLTSRIKAGIDAATDGQLIPDLNESDFEIEFDFSKDKLPLGSVKFIGSSKKEDGLLAVSGGIPEDYPGRLDFFGVGEALSDFRFKVFFNGRNIDSGALSVESPKSFIKTDFQTSNGNLKANYKIEFEDVFYVSGVSRFFRPYSVSGAFKSFGRIEKKDGSKIFLSGNARMKNFSATILKRLHIEEGNFNFSLPLEDFSMEELLFNSSMEGVSYEEAFAEELDFSFTRGGVRMKFGFEESGVFEIASLLGRENGNLYADVKKIDIKRKGSGMELFRDFRVAISEKMIEVGRFTLFGKKGTYFSFSGFYKRRETKPELNINADFVRFDTTLLEIFHPPLKHYKGLFSGKIIADGPVDFPVVNVDLNYTSEPLGARAGLSIVRAAFSKRFSVNLSIENESGSFLNIDGGVSPTGEGPYEITEFLREPSNYDLILKANKFSVRPVRFLSEKIQNLDGLFSGDLSVFNNKDGFSVSGRIDINDAKVKVGDWTEVMEIESAGMDFEENQIRSSFRLMDSSGTARGEGIFNLGDFSYFWEVELEGVFLHIKHLYSGFYGTLFIDGSGRNIRIRAKDLKTKDAAIWIRKDYNIAVAGLVFVDSSGGEEFADVKSPGFFSETSDLDFRLLISRDTNFRLDKVNSLLTGDLHILRKPGDSFSSVSGELSVFRGSYSMFGKRFVIDKGVISLFSREHLTPLVDINAFYEKNGLSIKVSLYGEANDLKLRLSSVPAMKQDEILLAILREKNEDQNSTSDIFEEVRDGQAGNDFTIGYVADELFSSVFEDSEFADLVDVFKVQSDGGDVIDSKIEVGTFVTEDLYFSYERVNESLPISASYRNRFTAQYRLTPNFTLEGVAGGITPGANLLFNIDFK